MALDIFIKAYTILGIMKKINIVFPLFLLVIVFGFVLVFSNKAEASHWGAPSYPNYSSNYDSDYYGGMGYGYGNGYSRWGSNGYHFPSYYPESDYGYGYNGYSGYNNNYNNYSSYNPYSYYNDYGYNNYNNYYNDDYYGYNNWYNDDYYNYGGYGYGYGNYCYFGC